MTPRAWLAPLAATFLACDSGGSIALLPEICSAPSAAVSAAAPAETAFHVLVFSRTLGYRHASIPAGIAAIERLGAMNSFAVEATEDPTAFNDANLARFAVVVFLSTTGPVLDSAQQAAFQRYIGAGHGFVGVHSATDTEYDWPWYHELVGATFLSHPAIQTASVILVDTAQSSTRGLPQPWTREDEWYNFTAQPTGVTLLVRVDEASYQGGVMGATHPISWQHTFDGGRGWYTAMGHTSCAFSETAYLVHLLGGIEWAAGF